MDERRGDVVAGPPETAGALPGVHIGPGRRVTIYPPLDAS